MRLTSKRQWEIMRRERLRSRIGIELHVPMIADTYLQNKLEDEGLKRLLSALLISFLFSLRQLNEKKELKTFGSNVKYMVDYDIAISQCH
ncbi:CLUMA_CG002292, isoform A [Clunio marinus]|uniref:CLUMA_CG002292, isoform A n=1 Tax=Clunio marinus TaxID=568069 RepID=A0A1J1HMB9_9DIPT|nr:CLUMA_CG002292, isoform A [Clunio marinus]